MNNTEIQRFKSKGGVEFTINVFGTEQKHTLPEDMTVEEFKSFVLSLTDSEVFDLRLMISNKSTLKDLKEQIVAWNTKFAGNSSETIEVFKRDYKEKNPFDLHYINKKDNKVGTIKKLKPHHKLREIIKDLEKAHGKPAEGEAFEIMFADGVTDVQSYTNDK